MKHIDRLAVFAAATIAAACSLSFADIVTLKNGDKINGSVGTVSGGKMAFHSPVLGDLSIDVANVESYTTDEPAKIVLKDRQPEVIDKIAAANGEKIDTAGGKTLPVSDVKSINPPAEKWSGSVLGNSTLQRGNTDTFDLGVKATAALRRDNDFDDDRTTFGAEYNYATTGRSDATATTSDNWTALGKYDKFWTEKLYGYATVKVDHDRIADLYYRLSPGIGLGYQWLEGPTQNFNTEVGFSYVYEKYDGGENNEFVALRLAYHYDRKLNEAVTLFHDLEYLPAIKDPGDYILTTDLGVRAMLTKSFFTEARVEYKRDSTPAPDTLKNDLKYVIGVGWTF